ncbi:MAG: 1-deoxy-D-xylulose-5-phosphate synthase [Syntrophobacterales bacterium]|jgi:1-deoxy-D-xylulose-5-phosphate synthase|nr:1-deoxy-D-xylulose-5-phosphate synthase [Syntrophobacterales bacterium]
MKKNVTHLGKYPEGQIVYQRPLTSILDTVNSPEDLRRLKIDELTCLAEEVRYQILDTVSRTGGHLASSLGAVELTLALHYVFNTPVDKLVWDVGHQTYAHKIVTGRKDLFQTLRQQGGISGFPKRKESIFDVFDVGHSGTSISAAAGFAEARCLRKETFKVLAVIGDGSMTSGMAYEGLNWAGDRHKNLVIILNDNEMSISPNVGALSSYLNRIMTGQPIMKLRGEIKNFLKTIPSVGHQMIKFTRHAEESLKSFFVPGALFEELGFTYVGPLEGHRLVPLIKNLTNVREMEGPILVHVVTQKGKGYPFAEAEPHKFHSISAFNLETGIPQKHDDTAPTYTQVFGDTLVQMAQENERLVAITAAMCEGTGLESFSQLFPLRFFDVGIAEQHGVTFASALAAEGIIPVVAIYSTFLQRAYDQLLHDACLQDLHVIFALDRGGLVGEDGATHHGLFDHTYLRSLPNMIVMAPKDENELRHMMATAVETSHPVAIRYPRGKGVGVPLDEPLRSISLGKGEILCDGHDLVIAAIGSAVYPALDAAQELKEMGISAKVINARFIKPLDTELICKAVQACPRLITVEENVLMGGFGSAVLEMLQENDVWNVRVCRLGIPDQFVDQGTQHDLRRIYGIDKEGIIAAACKIMGIYLEESLNKTPCEAG